jgi:putative MATE family efflux protein
MAQTQKHTEDLGTLGIGKLLSKLSIPAAIGMMVMVMYTVIDTIFVSRYVGTMAVGGLAIVLPITMLISAVGMALGAGGASSISRLLGMGNSDKANTVFGNLLMLTLTIILSFLAIGYIFPETILKIFGAEGEILPFASEYYLIVLAGTPFLGLSMAANNIIRSEGNARMSMIVMLVSAVLNLLLDYILIIEFNQGIRGAAFATLASQILTFLFIAYYFLCSNKSSVKLQWKHVLLDLESVREVVSIGASSFARQGSSSVVAIAINHGLMIYGSEVDVAIFGIINRIILMAVFPMIGLVQGFLPIMGYNFGAKNIERIRILLIKSFGTAFVIGIFSLIVMGGFPKAVFSLFSTDLDLVNSGASYLRIVVLMMPLVGVQMLGASFFQAIGKAKPALFLTLARQIIFLLPLVYILPNTFDLIGIWMAFPISDVLSTIITLAFLWPYRKDFFRKK